MDDPREFLKRSGIETLHGRAPRLPRCVFEPPCSIKWMQIEHSLEMDAFSYAVSGYYFAARIGRYVSIGENVQIGRHNHPLNWASTSPFFYLHDKMFEVGDGFAGSSDYEGFKVRDDVHSNVRVQPTMIEPDVWIGHGAFVRPGVRIGTGAVIGAHSVVTKDVPPYAVVAGNPAVIKRSRVAPQFISGLLRSRWWRYAPWDLRDLDFSDPQKFLRDFNAIKDDLQEYVPEKVKLEL